MREPTARQAQVWEAVTRLGSQKAAADELGVHPGSINSAFRGYMAATGEPWPSHVRRYQGSVSSLAAASETLRSELEAAQARIIRLEDRLARLEEENEELRDAAEPFARLEAKLDQLLSRPAIVASSRRITDGGEGEKHQRRRLAREHRAA